MYVLDKLYTRHTTSYNWLATLTFLCLILLILTMNFLQAERLLWASSVFGLSPLP